MELAEADRRELLLLGEIFDERPLSLGGETVGEFLAGALLRVKNKHGELVPLRANRVQEEFARRRGQRNVVLKARQMGVSTWVAGRFFLKTVTQPGTLTVQVAHTQEAAEAIFRTVHRFVECLPASLKSGALRTSRANVRQICFPLLDSEYRVESAADENVGRGMTITNLHCSEVARWMRNTTETLQGLKAGLAPHGELVLESTPNGAAGSFWDEWRGAEATGTVRHFFPWWWEETYKATPVQAGTLDEEETRLVAEQGLTPEQIGYRRQMRAGFGEMAAQEYAEDAETCFAASGQCVFDTRAIDRRVGTLRKPMESRNGGRLLVWYPPAIGKKYLIAVDPAGGGAEGDNSVAQVLELESGLQCAELQAKLTVLELALAVEALGREYRQALLVVERNNHGSGVLAHLGGRVPKERLFAQGGQDGWLTSSVSRPRMLARLGAALVERPEIFQSERLLRECRSFVRLPNGSVGAQSGTHDDCVMAMAIGLAARAELR